MKRLLAIVLLSLSCAAPDDPVPPGTGPTTGTGGTAGTPAGSGGGGGGPAAGTGGGSGGSGGAAGAGSGGSADAGAGAVDSGGGGPDATVMPPNATERELIMELVSRIKVEDVEAKMKELEALSQPNRVTGSMNYRRATEWAKTIIETDAPGATVRFDEQMTYRNVEITIKGSDPQAGMYIVGGHLDSVRATPGMDDNGSGSTGALLVARALGRYKFKADIRVLLFDAEEIGYVGSNYYATALKMGGCAPTTCLKLFVNMDMIGHDPNNRGGGRLLGGSMALKTLMTKVSMDYLTGFTLSGGGDGSSCHSSDDCSFSKQGYATVYIIEPTFFSNRHTPADVNGIVNFKTMTGIIQLVAATFATSAQIEGRR